MQQAAAVRCGCARQSLNVQREPPPEGQMLSWLMLLTHSRCALSEGPPAEVCTVPDVALRQRCGVHAAIVKPEQMCVLLSRLRVARRRDLRNLRLCSACWASALGRQKSEQTAHSIVCMSEP